MTEPTGSAPLPPAGWLADGGVFPDGPFQPDTPPYALVAAEFAKRLQRAMAERAVSQVALQEQTAIARSTMNDILRGRRMPSFANIVAFQSHLQAELMPTLAELGLNPQPGSPAARK